MSECFDIAIVGGGMVGASLAAALENLDVKTALIEAVPVDAASQPSFDERTTALSNGSRRILETLGVWAAVSGDATPIRKVHVSDRGHFGFARIDAAEQGLRSLGSVVPNRSLGSALWSRLSGRADVRVFCPARVARLEERAGVVALDVSSAPDGAASIEARLVVAADGIDSAVRRAFGVEADVRDYHQTAVITTVLPKRFHDNVAYERFTESGPLALLPLADGRCTLVLTLARDLAATAMSWSDEEFLTEVQRRFGFRLGRFLKAGRRVAYPLSLSRARRTSAGRCVIVGNAAQGLHPVAGMGFNLGLRDAASLAELIAEHRRELGGESFMAAYDAWRAADRREIIAFTDGLVRLFSTPFGPVRQLRNLGLLAFDLLPPAKAALSSLSTGAAGRIPKLARGVPLARRPEGQAS
ncbi:MAG TPA: 2-octaprenyl-6-methoxyphenyl hydroxylase [Steroidobacteraceae bacterium]|jgi:2-octaprenyl-6-methoxyphenol hydroxylase|nr:2-octaprenyl-6-methoxyphenyl hydroxylase [Steroidobacteraceae bacterium]